MRIFTMIALAMMITICAPQTGQAQEARAPETYVVVQQPKSVPTAVLFSMMVPGGGQFYNGHNGKGALFLGSWAAGPGFVLAGAMENTTSNVTSMSSSASDDGEGKMLAGTIIMLGASVISMIDAGASAGRINEEHAAARFGHMLEFENDGKVIGLDLAAIDNAPGAAFTLHF